MHEQPAALHVREELVAEARALAGALDQPGDVGHHELAVVALDRAEHRLERGERVVGHLRLRAREAREQRRLARVRQPTSPASASSLQAQLEPALLARQAALGEARRLARGGGEVPVAAPAAARRAPPRRAGRGSIRSQRSPPSASSHDGAGRHAHLERLGRRAVLARALAVAAALRP